MTHEYNPLDVIPAAARQRSSAVTAALLSLSATGNPAALFPERCHMSSGPGRGSGRNEARRLRAEIDRLRNEVRDQQIALLASNEHGDLLLEQLYGLSTSLAVEIRERRAADEKVQQLVKAISKEKGDLEVLVQILIDQGDEAAVEGEKARIDGLTQIANRRRFDECLLNEWTRHLRMQMPLSLLVCDVDYFKLYNDCYGHQAGDECLKAVAAAINQCCRAAGLVARYGGEEFAIVLPNTHREAPLAVAEQVRSAISKAALPHSPSPICSRVTMSIGIACRTPQPKDAPDARSLIAEADRNLYLAKHRGRNRAVHSNEEGTGLL